MGVPAFFKWLSTKYPKIVVDCNEERATWDDDGQKVPVDTSKPNPNGYEYDNLYLDMNGIIHPASHPEDRPPPETEDDMYLSIFSYLERVFAAVRPRKLLFMAIDGVAPRAKMNQQRARRFRAAQEAQEKEEEEARLREEWAKEGREVPPKSDKPPFDSNVITPGTPFMDRLALFLRTFIHFKLSTDPGWANITVILSDGSVPGEGEHKIMEYIRHQRQQPGYEANTRHAIHGLDADLIMLALATHEPHFSILREFVGPATGKGGGRQQDDLATQIEKEIMRKAEAEAEGQTGAGSSGTIVAGGIETGGAKGNAPTPFQFLHISVLREYLRKEFADSGDYSCVGGFELERVIDDFIFLCFFVGNDFLPHLPSLDIRLGAIDTLCDLYKTIFPKLGGWICDGGRVQMGRAKLFAMELGSLEDELLQKHRMAEERQRDQKRRREAEVRNKETSRRHRDMLQRVAEIATVPKASRHIQGMRGGGGGGGGEGGEGGGPTKQDYENALGRDAAVCEIFDLIKAFSELPDDAPAQKLPTGLNGYQRAMMHQYCEELGVANEKRGSDPNTESWLVKKGDGANESAAARFKRELDTLVKKRNTFEEEEDQVQLGVPGWKARYYTRKFSALDEDGCASVARSYVEGLCWVMRYYYEGCASWTWFFPFHYAPFAADIAEAIDPNQEPAMELGRPFKPFEQLMGVLPPRSSHALPRKLAELMTDPHSELADFYPTDFAIDLNGKRFAWQAVVLLPFIDEERLLSATEDLSSSFTAEERRRNRHGEPMFAVSRAHAEFERVVAAYGPPSKPLELSEGIFGEGVPMADAPPPHQTLTPPEFRGMEVHDAPQPFHNVAVAVVFKLPALAPGRPGLLPNVTMPVAVLGPSDVPVVKPGSFVSARGGGGGHGRGGYGGGGGRGGGGGGGGGRHPYQRLPSDRFPVDEFRVNGMIEERCAARQARDFGRADRLRNDLRALLGIELDDNQRTWWATRASVHGASPPAGSPPTSPPHGGPYGGHHQHYPQFQQPYQSHQPYPPYPHHQPPPRPPHGGGHYPHLPPAGMHYHPQQHAPPPQAHHALQMPAHFMPGGQQHQRSVVAPFGGAYGGGGGGGGPQRSERQDHRHNPYGRPEGGGGGGGSSQASDLLRSQLQAPRPGAPAADNRSAADLLRKQLSKK